MLKDDQPLSYHPHAIKWFSSSLYSYHLDQKGILHYLIEYSFTDYGNGNFPTIKKTQKTLSMVSNYIWDNIGDN